MKKLIIGLGNPGIKYKKTRHNVGFSAIDTIAKHYCINNFQNKYDGQIAQKKILDHEVIFFMPMLFMNNSGIPIDQVVNFYKLLPHNIFVIYDDLDLSVQKIKIKIGGYHAGHNGLKSINKYIGNQYMKIKIGIGRPSNNYTIIQHVLGNFYSDELLIMNRTYWYLANHLKLILNSNIHQFSNLYYSKR